MPLIQPRVLKGFRDFLPPQELKRRAMTETIERSFRSFGFVPIDTPALEYTEILLGKGGGETDKQVYRFTDHGNRDVSLRFDLTIPFARFTAEHRSSLIFPFKRYHIAKVWRGENTQRGRYREFTQCDFDIIGSDSAAADFEILLMIHNTLQSLCIVNNGKISDITIRLNHRGLFNRFLTSLGLEEKAVEILRHVDKLAKIGRERVEELLGSLCDQKQCRLILDYISLGLEGDFDKVLEKLCTMTGEGEDIQRLKDLRLFMIEADISGCFKLDPSITRGLDYYTGVVYESFLDKIPNIGSVCSGGRYDNLTGLYSKDPICGAGASIGLDRLQAALEELHLMEQQGDLTAQNSADYGKNDIAYADIAIVCRNIQDSGKAQKTAEVFRQKGLNCEVFLEEKKISAQFITAEKKGIPWVLIPDYTCGYFSLRNISRRETSENLNLEAVLTMLKKP